MPLIAKVTSQCDLQAEFMRVGRSGEGLSGPEFRALAKRLIDEEVNQELMPALAVLETQLQAAEDAAALDPAAIMPESVATALLEAYDEVADAIVDSVYVLMQLANTIGVPFDACFYEVHRSNMSKFVEDPVKGGLTAIKDEGGKILKGPNFSKPYLKPLLVRALFHPTPEPAAEAPQAAEHVDHTQIH